MGVKMSKAMYCGHRIAVSEYKEYMKNSIQCVYCGTPITYVSGHVKQIGDRDVQVHPYFRLVNKNHPHDAKCQYNTSAAIEHIYAGVADDDLFTKRDDQYITRLHIITDSMEKRASERSLAETGGPVRKKNTKKYIKNGEKSAYLSALKQIVQLKEALDDDEELKKRIKLEFYNEKGQQYDTIKWEDFYVEYDVKRYQAVYEMLKTQKVFHPICFSGEIKEVKHIGEGDYYVIQFYSLKIEPGEYISLSIASQNKEVFDYASGLIDKKVVIYGCNHSIRKSNTVHKDCFR